MESIRVLLVDDHALVRAGIAQLLKERPGIEVVGEAADGLAALRLVEESHPDVVLMDISLPGSNGITVTEEIVRGFPEVRVLILSAQLNEIYVSNALRAGAAGYLLKDADISELETAIRAAARGETYLTGAVSRQVVEGYMRRLGGASGVDDLDIKLTSRQREILQLIAQSLPTREIATRLFISEKTVLAHRSQMMHRLGVQDVTGLVRYAIRKGIISP